MDKRNPMDCTETIESPATEAIGIILHSLIVSLHEAGKLPTASFMDLLIKREEHLEMVEAPMELIKVFREERRSLFEDLASHDRDGCGN